LHELDPSARSRDDKRKEKRFDVNLKGKVFDQLANFAYDKQVSPVPLRSAVRTAQLPPLQRFICSDGSEAACEVVDIALGGVALKTDARPAIGALLRFGDVVGRVVRHTDDGVAVEFMGKKPAAG